MSLDPAATAAWVGSDAGAEFVRAAADGWAEAAIADGDDPDAAHTAAARTITFYTTSPDEQEDAPAT